MRRAAEKADAAIKADVKFQSTLSVRRAANPTPWDTLTTAFQSTLSVRRATTVTQVSAIMSEISIHALREESDK